MIVPLLDHYSKVWMCCWRMLQLPMQVKIVSVFDLGYFIMITIKIRLHYQSLLQSCEAFVLHSLDHSDLTPGS